MKFLAFFLLLSALAGTASAQESNEDQVGLVIPAFFGEGNFDNYAGLVVKTGIQGTLSKQEPFNPEVRNIGRAITFHPPAPMADPSHETAVRLAQLNGLQGTVWGYSTQLVDGLAYNAFLTLSPPYEDYREQKREIWEHRFGEIVLSLGPPRSVVAFDAAVFDAETIAVLGRPDGLEYCPVDGGACRRFSDVQVTRLRSFNDGRAVIRRGGVDYEVVLPLESLSDSDVVAYSGLFLSYARGNLNQTIVLASDFLERGFGVSQRIDALLFRAAAYARQGNFDEASEDIASALELSPRAQRTLRYALMLELVREETSTELAQNYLSELDINYGFQNEFDLSAFRLLSQ